RRCKKVSKPLPLGGLPGQVIIQSNFFFNKDFEYLRYGSKGRRPALSISKMKATYYPDAGLEKMVPDQFWINEEYKYDIDAMYDLEMDEDIAPDEQAQSSDDEDIEKPAWSIRSSDVPVLTNNWPSALESNYLPPPEDSLLAQTGDITTFMDWFCKGRGITEHKPQDLEGPAYEIVKVFHPDVIHLQYQMEECHKLLTDSECKYDIAAMYVISHWWFQRQRFYIDQHTSKGDRSAVRTHMRLLSVVRIKVFFMYGAVRTHMRILSVVRIEVFSMYGYDYMKKIVLHRADLNEHVIAERDFKYMYPSDFEDLYLLNIQEDFQLRIESYQAQLNLTKPQWDATGFEYKHDYTVIDSPRAVIFQDKYGVQMMMCFNEIHKFSDGTLQQIDEALDYRVKEFKINRMNPGLNTRFWTRKDVDRCKAFMFAIQRRLMTRRIFRNLESFVGGHVREGDYRLLKRIHVRYSEAFDDKEDLPQPRELCWWTRQRGRLQTFEAY
nr:hypothetical protein [Tanacetum cinerariifolium]